MNKQAVVELELPGGKASAVRQVRGKPRHQPRYHVVLWNDEDHSYAYVMVMLRTLFGYPLETGYRLAEEVDKRGRCIVLTTTLEHAEFKRDQIHAFGKDALVANCHGSMSATIEAAGC